MQQSTACLHFRGVQRRCVWAVGRLGVAACLACVAAAAVDRQARSGGSRGCADTRPFLWVPFFKKTYFENMSLRFLFEQGAS